MNNKYNVNIDMSLLPRLKGYGGVRIDWKNSIGYTIPFVSYDITGCLTIVDNKQAKVLIKRHINIDDVKNQKEIWVLKNALLKCDLRRSVFKEIAFTRPDLIKYFDDINDAFKFVKTDHDAKTCFKCPKCGYKKIISIQEINGYGFTCDKCRNHSNGYPNKFMMNMLDQLHCDYIMEANKNNTGFQWLDKYRFDFLLKHKENLYFIEMDGYFHFNNNRMSGLTAEEAQQIDRRKDKIATENGLEVIRIDCNYRGVNNRFAYIKNNIISSDLMNILEINESDIDWELCDKNALSNVLYCICECWNAGTKDTKTIAKQLGVSWSCVYENLKKGANLGLCDYDPNFTKKMTQQKQKDKASIPVKVIKNGDIIGIFESSRELSRQSEFLFGVFFNPGHLSYSRRYGCSCHGYKIQDATREEYEQFHNNTKLI